VRARRQAAEVSSSANAVLALQRSAGNQAVVEFLTARPRTAPTVAGGGSVSLHGDTRATYDGGTSAWAPRSMRRSRACTDCPEDNPCVHAVGQFSIRYHVDVDISMPAVPGGLTECQERNVRTFLRTVLAPHEQDHARRFRTYNGRTVHPIDFTGCGTEALQAHLQQIHDDEESKRQSDADALSAAIDPFNRTVDLDCEDTTHTH
jgi:hypothetical protein